MAASVVLLLPFSSAIFRIDRRKTSQRYVGARHDRVELANQSATMPSASTEDDDPLPSSVTRSATDAMRSAPTIRSLRALSK